MTNGECIHRKTVDYMSRMALQKDDFIRFSVTWEFRVIGNWVVARVALSGPVHVGPKKSTSFKLCALIFFSNRNHLGFPKYEKINFSRAEIASNKPSKAHVWQRRSSDNAQIAALVFSQNSLGIRHGLMLLWFTDLMNVTEEVTIHRPNVSTLLSSAFIRGDLNAATRGLFIWSLSSGIG